MRKSEFRNDDGMAIEDMNARCFRLRLTVRLQVPSPCGPVGRSVLTGRTHPFGTPARSSSSSLTSSHTLFTRRRPQLPIPNPLPLALPCLSLPRNCLLYTSPSPRDRG
eukprot:1783840-Rhodomonas_salina.4